MNKKIGSIFIVAGTSIGAGMLALPLEARHINFETSIVCLLTIWALTLISALFTTNLFIKFPEQKTLPQLANHILGPIGKYITIISFTLLHYSLLAAYTAGSFEIMSLWLPNIFHIVFLSLIIFLIVYAYKAIDITNRFLFIAQIGVFFLFLYYLFYKIQIPTELSFMFNKISIPILSMIFTSFGFHGSIAVIINYLGHNKKDLYQTFIIGSIIPLIVYTIWIGIAFGSMDILPDKLSVFIKMLSCADWNCKIFVNLFSLLAIFTSFIGVGLALFDFNLYSLNKKRILSVFATFLPSLFFVLFYQEGFVLALRYAASFLSIFAIILPFAMYFKLKKSIFSFLLMLSGIPFVFF